MKTLTDKSIIHVQEETGEMQSYRQRLYRKLVYFHRPPHPVHVLFVSVVMQTNKFGHSHNFPSARVERESFSR